MLTLSHIRKDYGKFTAVEDINLELENGLYAMLAPNGAGKTTLIKMITTLLYPTSGEILYDGMDIYKMGETYRGLTLAINLLVVPSKTFSDVLSNFIDCGTFSSSDPI